MLGSHARSRLVRLVNVVLVVGVGGVTLLFGQSLLAHYALQGELSGDEPVRTWKAEMEQRAARSTQQNRSLPDLAQFQIVVERDPFRTVLVNLRVVPSVTKVAIPNPPLPPLNITLAGTIVIGDERKAILRDSKQEDVYSVGQAVAGGVLAAVEYDRVWIARGSERTEVLLKNAMEGDGPVVATLSSQASASAAGDRKNKTSTVGKSLFATPAFARYPGVGTQPKGDHD